jgi:hypothetical protein
VNEICLRCQTIDVWNRGQKHINMAASCIFCKIIKGEIPSMKLFESDKTLAFLDINPLSLGHAVRVLPFSTYLATR